MNYVRLFLEFLAKNRCLGSYFYNFEKQAKSDYGPEYPKEINYLLSGNPEIYLTGAFLFFKTIEGEDYWLRLDDDWCAYLKNNLGNER